MRDTNGTPFLDRDQNNLQSSLARKFNSPFLNARKRLFLGVKTAPLICDGTAGTGLVAPGSHASPSGAMGMGNPPTPRFRNQSEDLPMPVAASQPSVSSSQQSSVSVGAVQAEIIELELKLKSLENDIASLDRSIEEKKAAIERHTNDLFKRRMAPMLEADEAKRQAKVKELEEVRLLLEKMRK